MGKFGDFSNSNYIIWKCGKCKAGFLDRSPIDYESTIYRRMVDGDSSPQNYYALHDGEQANNLKILDTGNLRNKIIADIGCGAGSFLDLVKGYAKHTIAVEPTKAFQQELRKKGHRVYGYTKDALKDWQGRVDLAVCFAVVEHVEKPLKFLKEIKSLLRPNGFLLLSTPNAQDWLIEFLPSVYDKFFYRYVHTWYFNQESIQQLGIRAGFKNIQVHYVQRFGISNALHWIRDHCPTGKTSLLQDLDEAYRQVLEKQKCSDYLYAWMIR